MRAVLSRSSLMVALAALALAFAMALAVYTSGANAQAEKFWLCHNTGSGTNPFVAILVDDDSIPQAHEGHGDFILGPESDFPEKPDATAACNAEATTTTTTGQTPPPTSTTSNVNTTANTTSISVTTSGNCVQTAIQQQVGNTNVAGGDIVNFQNISQECNITITQAKKMAKTLGVSKFGKV